MVNEKQNPYARCGFEFTKEHLASFKAKNEQCSSCNMTGHFARISSHHSRRKKITNWKRLASKPIFRVGEANKNSEYNNAVNNKDNQNIYIENLKQKFPWVFTRQEKIKGHEVKIEFKKDAKITQQKGRRMPLQLQEAVEKGVDKLLAEGHIRRVEKVSDEVFNGQER